MTGNMAILVKTCKYATFFEALAKLEKIFDHLGDSIVDFMKRAFIHESGRCNDLIFFVNTSFGNSLLDMLASEFFDRSGHFCVWPLASLSICRANSHSAARDELRSQMRSNAAECKRLLRRMKRGDFCCDCWVHGAVRSFESPIGEILGSTKSTRDEKSIEFFDVQFCQISDFSTSDSRAFLENVSSLFMRSPSAVIDRVELWLIWSKARDLSIVTRKSDQSSRCFVNFTSIIHSASSKKNCDSMRRHSFHSQAVRQSKSDSKMG